MKPERISIFAVSCLLAAAALSLGVRHGVDVRARDSRRASHAGEASGAPPPVTAAAPSERARAVIARLDAVTMAQRIRAAMKSGEPQRAALELCDQFGPDDWPVAMQALKEIGGYGLFLSAWAEVDPRAAVAWVGEDVQASCSVLTTWASMDPDAALEYVHGRCGDPASNPLGAKSPLIVAALRVLVPGDLPRLGRELAAYPSNSWGMLVEGVMPGLVALDQAALKSWLDPLDPDLKKSLVLGIMPRLKDTDARLALVQDYPEEIGPESYGPIYSDLAKKDLPAATAALEKIDPGSPLHAAAAGGVIYGAYRSGQFTETVELLRRFPGIVPDGALHDMILSGASDHAAAVADILPEIHDGPLRLMSYREVLTQWLRQDPVAAHAWLQAHDAPEQIRREFDGK